MNDEYPDLEATRRGLAAYDPSRLRREASACFGEYVQTRPKRRPNGVSRIAKQFRRLVEQTAGPWFPGLAEEWQPAWCACHCIPLQAEDIDKCVELVCQQVGAVHRLYEALVDEATRPLDDDPTRLGARIIEHVVEATGCNDAWYYEAIRAFELVLHWRGIDPRPFHEAFEQQVSTSFESWAEPTPEAVKAVTRAYSRILAEG